MGRVHLLATEDRQNETALTLAVLDYEIGNLRSAQKALEYLGANAILTADPEVIEQADGVVLPGVGSFGASIDALHRTGLFEVALAVAKRRQPFLGICVGMQMMYEGSDESPESVGLGLLAGRVVWLPPTVKRPQMQWNQLATVEHPLVAGLNGEWVYFVHSLAPDASDPQVREQTIATTTYGGSVVAAAASSDGPIYATQFHPEKSALAGLALLSNFVECCRQQQSSTEATK